MNEWRWSKLLTEPRYRIIEAIKGINANVLSLPPDKRYDAAMQGIRKHHEVHKTLTTPGDNYTVVFSYIDDRRCYESLQAVVDYFTELYELNGIKNTRFVALVSDLCWDNKKGQCIDNWDTSISEYNGCEIYYINYSDKVSLFHKYNFVPVRSQPWSSKHEKLMYLPGHLMNLGHRVPYLYYLWDKFGKDKIKYTLSIPEEDNNLWEVHKIFLTNPNHPKQYPLNYASLSKIATSIGDNPGVTYGHCKYAMSGIGMPSEIYNDCLVQIISKYSHRCLTEKVPRAVLNDMPVLMSGNKHLNKGGYHIFDYSDIDELPDLIEYVRTHEKYVKETMAHNKNLLNSRGKEFYRNLDTILQGNLEKVFLEGGLFSYAQ